jgi:serine/threonine protein kinase
MLLLTRSGVLERQRLEAYVRQRGGHSALPEDPLEFANQLVCDGLLTAFQAERLLQGQARSLVIGPYRLLQRLGPANSSVFLAEKQGPGTRLAIKVLPKEQAAGPSDVERFRREAQALARLNHPNVVRIISFEEEDGWLVLLTEYVEGRSLVELVERDGPLAAVQAARLIHGAAQGLEHIHAVGLVHRDIKPSHLMLDREGTVKLLDLGLARFLDERADSLTEQLDQGKVLGTIEYLAPEQMADSHDVDIRADVYGLGATFYYALTGLAPFSRHAILRLATGVVTRPQPLSQLRPDVPRQLVAIVERMMALAPGERYQTPCEVAEALHAWLREASVSRPIKLPPRPTGGVPGPAVLPAAPAKEAGGWSVAALLAFVLAFVLALWGFWKRF